MTAPLACTSQRQAHQLRVAHRLERLIGTTIGQLNNGVHAVFDFRRVGEMRHAALLREFNSTQIDDDTDDSVGTYHPRALNDIRSDAVETKQADNYADFDLAENTTIRMPDVMTLPSLRTPFVS
ncbi:hypothetical protein G3N97_12370 [Paraburkholderia sp. Ac-20347]|nr:hypothetical protein [Paraburkholderia sp. Ac-20347]